MKSAYELRISDWSADVCSSDLRPQESHTSATASPAAHGPTNPNRHRSPDTPTVTAVLMQNCNRCTETSHPRFWRLRRRSNTRSEERRVWKECVSLCRYRGSPDY